MRRAVAFCRYRSNWWTQRAEMRDNVPAVLHEGLRAYALANADAETRLGDRWAARWRPLQDEAQDFMQQYPLYGGDGLAPMYGTNDEDEQVEPINADRNNEDREDHDDLDHDNHDIGQRNGGDLQPHGEDFRAHDADAQAHDDDDDNDSNNGDDQIDRRPRIVPRRIVELTIDEDEFADDYDFHNDDF